MTAKPELLRSGHYSPLEERINIVSHATGLVLGILAFVVLLARAATYGNAWHIVSVGIFGASLIALYAASTIYHSSKNLQLRARMRTMDHAAIYVLIAGTYTPFTLITLRGAVGWTMFAITWGMAAIGIALKLFYTGRYNLISTLMYVFMGWVIVFAIKPLIESLSAAGMMWLISGGLAYTLGAVFYSIRRLPFSHSIFHIFVLIGSTCHFVAVYFFVLPTAA
ncbi:MAG TPA: hemolysin III family protein [Woeseiaceae bacterium]|nr:hemolysin III family protein [Woeseiaceae bacterium]